LIPDFGGIGSTSAWLELTEKGTRTARGLDAYSKFVLNNHLDLDYFNMIY